MAIELCKRIDAHLVSPEQACLRVCYFRVYFVNMISSSDQLQPCDSLSKAFDRIRENSNFACIRSSLNIR